MTFRVFAFVCGALWLLTACATQPAPSAQLSPTPLLLERDFKGRFYASGVFDNTLTGLKRPFTVVLDGRWDGTRLTLREAFAFADGERDVKTWVFTKLAEGRYAGTREDVIGQAEIVQEGAIIRLRYEAEVGASRTRVWFEDILERRSDGVIVNRAIVSKLGVPVGTVNLTFSKRPPL